MDAGLTQASRASETHATGSLLVRYNDPTRDMWCHAGLPMSPPIRVDKTPAPSQDEPFLTIKAGQRTAAFSVSKVAGV